MAWTVLTLVVVSSLPYLGAWIAAPEGSHFTGLLFNPIDGHSYVAKMRQGLEGSWRFRLPYTSGTQDGAPVYLFYLSLGHLARWTGLPLIMMYHLARIVGGALMLVLLYVLASWLSENVHERRMMFLLAAFGAGLGWLMGVLGVITADLWIPEAFPVYALLASAHFPAAMALMAGSTICGLGVLEDQGPAWGVGVALTTVILGGIQPFGLIAVFGGVGLAWVMRAIRERKVPWRAGGGLTVAGVLALLYPLYMQWVLRADPVLKAWSAQNVTLSPPLWNWALSYGLVLILAVPGTVVAMRRATSGDWSLVGWVLVTLGGMYAPLPLQRRLSLGLGVPMGLLAGMGWWRAIRPRISGGGGRKWVQRLMLALCAMTPVFLTLASLLAAVAGDPNLYISEGEWAALAWLRDEGEPETIVLCSPQMGLFVPAWAGQRVIYGHPFETVNAERREAQVRAYWAGEMSPAEQRDFLRENDVGYVLVGPREFEIGEWEPATGNWRLAFETKEVRIYEVGR